MTALPTGFGCHVDCPGQVLTEPLLGVRLPFFVKDVVARQLDDGYACVVREADGLLHDVKGTLPHGGIVGAEGVLPVP